MKNYKIFLFIIVCILAIFSIEAKPKQGKAKVSLMTMMEGEGAMKQQTFTGMITDDGGMQGMVKGFYVLKAGKKAATPKEIKALRLMHWSKRKLIKEGQLFVYCVDTKNIAMRMQDMGNAYMCIKKAYMGMKDIKMDGMDMHMREMQMKKMNRCMKDMNMCMKDIDMCMNDMNMPMKKAYINTKNTYMCMKKGMKNMEDMDICMNDTNMPMQKAYMNMHKAYMHMKGMKNMKGINMAMNDMDMAMNELDRCIEDMSMPMKKSYMNMKKAYMRIKGMKNMKDVDMCIKDMGMCMNDMYMYMHIQAMGMCISEMDMCMQQEMGMLFEMMTKRLSYRMLNPSKTQSKTYTVTFCIMNDAMGTNKIFASDGAVQLMIPPAK